MLFDSTTTAEWEILSNEEGEVGDKPPEIDQELDIAEDNPECVLSDF